MKAGRFPKAIFLGGFVAGSLVLARPVVGAKSQSIGGITMTEVAPRIVTPNGDAMNDKIFFRFDTSVTGIPIETSVFNVNGAKIASLIADATGDFMTWDGRDENGNTVPAGIYIYSIQIGKNFATGTVVVAR